MYKILVINLGSTSTKVAYYQNTKCVCKANLPCEAEELKNFSSIWEQLDYRTKAIENFMNENGIKQEELAAVATRGGHTHPLYGGTYRINEEMLKESRSEKYGNHACDLGLIIAYRFAQNGALPITANTPVTDEFEVYARYSGLPEVPRKSSFHALNHKAVAKKYAKDISKSYEDLNLIVVHMGGGISVAAHKHGKMVDANNALLGDGPFSTNRTGDIPVEGLIDICFSGKYTRQQVRQKLNGLGGMMAYIGINDTLTADRKADEGDKKTEEVLNAMAYQTSKEIAGCAAVLKGNVDAIILTGGMAHSARLTGFIEEHTGFIAPIIKYPGEYEMESLALNAYEVLSGNQKLLLFCEGEK